MEDSRLKTLLKAERISKRLSERAILENVDFELSPGEVVAIIGPSGCGKTTLLRALALLAPPDAGRLRIGEREFVCPWPGKPPWQTIYPGLTAVFQQFPLWPHLRVRQNILLPLELQGETNCDQRILELCEELGLTACLHRFPAQLSVGQRQRVALARAVMLRPKYLLLDEITSAQDVEHIKRITSLLKRIAAGGIGIVVATHLIGFARRLASRFYFIDGGRVVESGPIQGLEEPQSDRLRDFLLVGDTL